MLNMKNIGTKSINMSDIMVYLAMFSTTIDKMSYYFISLWHPLELGTFLIFQQPLPPPIWTNSQVSLLF